MEMNQVTQDEFDAFIDKNDYVVVCFGTQWCAPCKDFERVCQGLDTKYSSICFAKVDIEKAEQLAEDFSIRSVPFVMIVRQRTVLYADAGVLDQEELGKMLDVMLAMKDEKTIED